MKNEVEKLKKAIEAHKKRKEEKRKAICGYVEVATEKELNKLMSFILDLDK